MNMLSRMKQRNVVTVLLLVPDYHFFSFILWVSEGVKEPSDSVKVAESIKLLPTFAEVSV